MDSLKHSSPVAGEPRRGLLRRGPSPLALEQRFVFDGAAAVEVVDTLGADSAAADSAPAEPVVVEVQAPPAVEPPVNVQLGDALAAESLDTLTRDRLAEALAEANRLIAERAGEVLASSFEDAGGDAQAFSVRLADLQAQLLEGLQLDVRLLGDGQL